MFDHGVAQNAGGPPDQDPGHLENRIVKNKPREDGYDQPYKAFPLSKECVHKAEFHGIFISLAFLYTFFLSLNRYDAAPYITLGI